MTKDDIFQHIQAEIERGKREAEERVKHRREGRKRGWLSASLEEKLRSCNPLHLRRVKKVCDDYLADHLGPPHDFECGERYTRRVLAAVEIRNKRYQLELRDCGKHCGRCPHGPYLYSYFRDGSIIKQKYYRKNKSFRDAPRKVRNAIARVLHTARSNGGMN
jgi:hypothetical protein